MTYSEVRRLRPGDKVYWTDPAEKEYPDETCSRHIVVQAVYVCGEVVSIVEFGGGNLECFPHELSRKG